MMNEPNHKLSPENYRKILNGIDLVDISMIESKTHLNPEGKTVKDIAIKINDKCKFVIDKDNIIRIYQTYDLDARKPKSKSRFIQINVTFLVRLSSKETFTDDFFEIYKSVSLGLNTWPFFREFVHSTTARMNIPPMTLPLLKR